MANEIQKAQAEKNAIDLSAKLTPFEAAAFSGDLAKLAPEERGVYLLNYCKSMGINPLSGAIQFLMLDGRLVIYATKSCTQQLAHRDKVTVKTSEPKVLMGVLICEATAEMTLPDGQVRTANNIGAVPWDDKAPPKEKCNAIMKCITKAERRVILSICGLGIMDETELDTVEKTRYKRVTGTNFDVYEDEPGSNTGMANNPGQGGQRPANRPPADQLKDAAPKNQRVLKPFEKALADEMAAWMLGMKKTKDDWFATFAPGKKWAEVEFEKVYNEMLTIKNAPPMPVADEADIPAFRE